MGAQANADAYNESENFIQIGDFRIDIDAVTMP
jgi:hypothetical protein